MEYVGIGTGDKYKALAGAIESRLSFSCSVEVSVDDSGGGCAMVWFFVSLLATEEFCGFQYYAKEQASRVDALFGEGGATLTYSKVFLDHRVCTIDAGIPEEAKQFCRSNV